MYCTDRTHLVCGHQFSNCYPLTCTHLALRQCLMKRPPTDLTRLRETGSTLDSLHSRRYGRDFSKNSSLPLACFLTFPLCLLQDMVHVAFVEVAGGPCV